MIEPEAGLAGAISFGPFRLLPARRLLLEGDTLVPLGSRAREILLALVERPGELVGKDELVSRVWPTTFVEDGNLKVHVAALRRALGDGRDGRRYISTVPGRGYCFVAPVTVAAEDPSAPPQPAPQRPPDLPAPLARMVGRVGAVDAVEALLMRHRFATVVGPGGIGKTTVALAVAERLLGRFPDGVHFVDLAPLNDPVLVPTAVASALGVGVRSDHPVRSLAAMLRDRRLLVVLDSCEHVVDAAAATAEGLFAGAGAGLHILATSREPLRVEGERVHRLSALGCPPAGTAPTAVEALAFPAVQLFVERAAAGLDGYDLSDTEAPVVAELCRRLDGMALAIEIAAGRIDAFGVTGLASRLDDRFRLLLKGRRTAMPRHQTLSTTLDWSYALLPPEERDVLRRLAVLVGPFTMETAGALASLDGLASPEVVDAVANLVAKSLLAADVDGPVAHYRLLETTRAYALVKLTESGERDAMARRHAEHFREALDRAGRAWARQPAADWLKDHRHLLDNARAALDWAFSPKGQATIGVALTIGAVPLWFQRSLVAECTDRVRHALSSPAATLDAAQEMRLHAALAWSLMQTRGSVPETRTAWSRTLELAEALDDADHQLRAIWGLWAGLLNAGEFRPALALAERFTRIAIDRSDISDRLVGDRMVGYILHLLGEQTRARRLIERVVDDYAMPVVGARIIRFIFDQHATARCFLARILWLQGHADQATRLVEDIVERAQRGEDTLTLCQVLVQAACPVALFTGDLAAAARYVALLRDEATRNALDFWGVWGRCFEGVLLLGQGDRAAGLPLLGDALGELRAIQYGVYYIVFLADYADALSASGRVEQALSTIDDALTRSDRNEELWYMPELLRLKGELVLRAGGPTADAEAEPHFVSSLALARQQGTPAWSLRTAMSLARLRRVQHRPAEGMQLLAEVQDGFTEGFGTADLRAAAALRSELVAGSA